MNDGDEFHRIWLAVRDGRAPALDYTEEREQIAISCVLATIRRMREQHPLPIAQIEARARRTLRTNPDDQDAIIALWRATQRRRTTTLHPDRTETVEHAVAHHRRPDAARHYAVQTLARIWEWRTGKPPSLTVTAITGDDSALVTDPFFSWAGDLLARVFHRSRLSPHGLLLTLRRNDKRLL